MDLFCIDENKIYNFFCTSFIQLEIFLAIHVYNTI
jgi:hypothetical protein